MTMIWLSVMDAAYGLASESFFDAVVRYEDLCVHRLTVVNKLLEACSYSGNISGDADKIFDEDAHTSGTGGLVGSRAAATPGKAKKPLYIPETDIAALQTLIEYHVELKQCNYLLPTTIAF